MIHPLYYISDSSVFIQNECFRSQMNSQQAKLFEDRMANVFGGVDGAPSGDQINLTFQRMAGMMTNGFLNL